MFGASPSTLGSHTRDRFPHDARSQDVKLRLAASIIAALIGCGPVVAKANDLFVAVPPSELSAGQLDGSGVGRPQSVVRVNVRALRSSPRITLDIAPGVTFVAERRRIDARSASDFVWYGDVPAVRGNAILVVQNSLVTGTINAGPRVYSIRPLKRDGMHLISLLDYKRLPSEHPPMRE